jgi:hypothetical protein
MTQDPEMTPCGVSTGLRSRNPNPNTVTLGWRYSTRSLLLPMPGH